MYIWRFGFLLFLQNKEGSLNCYSGKSSLICCPLGFCFNFNEKIGRHFFFSFFSQQNEMRGVFNSF